MLSFARFFGEKMKMQRCFLGYALLAILLFGVSCSRLFDNNFANGQKDPSWQAQKVPDVALTALDGSKFYLSEYKDQVVLLHFWASWCAPCLEEFPSLLTLVDSFAGKVVLLAISTDDEKSSIDNFLSGYKKKYKKSFEQNFVRIAWDPAMEISLNKFNVVHLPETIILDPNLLMVRKIAGQAKWNAAEMKSYLSDLFAK